MSKIGILNYITSHNKLKVTSTYKMWIEVKGLLFRLFDTKVIGKTCFSTYKTWVSDGLPIQLFSKEVKLCIWQKNWGLNNQQNYNIWTALENGKCRWNNRTMKNTTKTGKGANVAPTSKTKTAHTDLLMVNWKKRVGLNVSEKAGWVKF